MTRKHTGTSETHPGQPLQDDHVAVNDRAASRGDAHADENNASAESNDAALIAGPSFVRKVNADGTVQAVPAPVPQDTAEDAASHADQDATDASPKP